MPLYWSAQDSIAKALLDTYPEQDRLALSLDGLRHLVTTLPDFADDAAPQSPAVLEKILWTWMRIADANAAPAGCR